MKLPAHVLFRKELSLMVWKPHGILDQALVNEIVAFVEAAEERVQQPFNRFVDLSALDAVDLNFRFVFHIALHRRLAFESHPPVKTAFYVTSPDTTHYAKLHAMLTDHSPLHVSCLRNALPPRSGLAFQSKHWRCRTFLRLHSQNESFFDKTRWPNEIEPVK